MAAPLTIDTQGPQTDQLSWITKHHPGVVTLFGDEISTTSAREAIHTLTTNSPSTLVAVDHEGGTVQRLNGTGFTDLPSWQTLCLQSETTRQTTLFMSANELQEVGIDVVFGPVVDLAASGSALRSRTCSASPELTAQRSEEFIKIFSEEDMLPVIKHFPGIGAVKKDLHVSFATIQPLGEELLVYEYLLPKYPTIGVMMAHVSIQGALEGEVCSLSLDCVQGFRGLFNQTVVFSDALDMQSAGYDPGASSSAAVRPLPDRALRAAMAGNDVLVFGPDVSVEELENVYTYLLERYTTDEDAKTAISSSAERVFALLQEKR